LGVIIDIPLAAQPAKVKVSGTVQTICAKGEASRSGGVYPIAIWAKIYQTVPTPIPTSPPAGSTQGTVSSDDQWSFTGIQEIPGATSAAQSPYPTNYLFVWAQYDDHLQPYDVSETNFLGQASDKTDCG
jgi:hypothetical protein